MEKYESLEVLQARITEYDIIAAARRMMADDQAIASVDVVTPYRGALRIHRDGRDEVIS